MKGFGSRERNGLLAFLIVLAILLAIGPLADSLGCTRRHEPPAPSVPSEVSAPDSVKASSEADSPAKEARRTRRKGKRQQPADSVRKPRGRKASGATRRSAPADPQRRSYLDEPI